MWVISSSCNDLLVMVEEGGCGMSRGSLLENRQTAID